MRKVTGAVEPEVMARAMLRPEDDVIRATDLPEREQLRPPVAPDNVDHRICAECAPSPLQPACTEQLLDFCPANTLCK